LVFGVNLVITKNSYFLPDGVLNPHTDMETSPTVKIYIRMSHEYIVTEL